MDHSRPGLPVHHQLPEPTQTPLHGVGLGGLVPAAHSRERPGGGSGGPLTDLGPAGLRNCLTKQSWAAGGKQSLQVRKSAISDPSP